MKMPETRTDRVDPLTVRRLRRLVEHDHDNARVLQEASETLTTPRVAAVLRELSLQRLEHATEIGTLIALAGEQPPTSPGTASGAVGSWWARLRALLPGDERKQLLAQAVGREESLLAVYRGALEGTDHPKVREVLGRHVDQIRGARDRLEELRREPPTPLDGTAPPTGPGG